MILKENLVLFIQHSNRIEEVTDPAEIGKTVWAWDVIKNEDCITLDRILYIHAAIMSSLNISIAGKLRECNVRVGNRICPSWRQVKKLLNRWIKKYGKGIRIEEEAKQAHIEFEKIHPFADGNGRTGRLIWLWMREKAGLPFQYIKYEERFEYYRWFDWSFVDMMWK